MTVAARRTGPSGPVSAEAARRLAAYGPNVLLRAAAALSWVSGAVALGVGIVACRLGIGLAARTERASLRSIGFTGNRHLLWGMAFEVVFAAALVALPPLRSVFGTAVPDPRMLALLPLFPVLVWGADEAYRWWLRRGPAVTGARAA